MSTDASTEAVTTETDGAVAVTRIDDGKANAITHDMIAAMHAGLDEAERDDDVGAVAIVGRPGRFSAGFDLSVMTAGMDRARDLLRAGGELGFRIYTFPKPVVLGVTGHALAMGAILLMSADVRIGAEGSYKIGLNEVAIGMPVPRFAVELARDRLSPKFFSQSVGQARIFSPTEATDVGYLDWVVDADTVEMAAIEHARTLASTLNRRAFQMTREFMRFELADRLRQGMDRDMELFEINA
jgi:enoyl-CoA hydratase